MLLSFCHFKTERFIFRLSLIGMSNSGKTSYIKKLLEQADYVFTEAPTRIRYYYNVFQPKFVDMEKSIANISFFQGLPQRSDIEEYGREERHLLLVFDDLYQDIIRSRSLSDLTIMLSHHLNISSIFSNHNIFEQGRFSKTIATNLHYILLLTLRNKLQLATLSTQLFCYAKKSKHFLQVYEDHLRENPFSPLIIDLSPKSPGSRFMLRANIFADQYPLIFELQ